MATAKPAPAPRRPGKAVPRKTTARGPSKRGGDRKTEQARLEAIERARQVVELRAAGLSFDVIAERTGFADRTGAHKAWTTAVRDVVRQPAREAVELELARYDAAQTYIWGKVRAGNLAAIDRFLAISKSRRALLGLDAAVKIDLGGEDAAAEVRDVAAELLTALRGGTPPTS